MPAPFPRRSLDSLKNEARRWLRGLHAADPDARARLRAALPEAPAAPTLRDVQLALAREHGFQGWPALKRALTPDPARSAATLAHYQAMADALLEAYRTGTPEAMERYYALTWHRRPWTGMRRYVQLDLGRRPSGPGDDVEITIDDARWLVARERGFEDWARLTASVAAMPAGAPAVLTPLEARAQRLREALDRDDATELDLGGVREIGDGHLADIGRMRRLERLNLAGTSITDAGVEQLRRLEALRDVNLAWTRTGDAAIRALAGKPALGRFVSGTQLTDDGVAALHDWPALVTWPGGDESLGLFAYSEGPTRLELRGSITDRGLARLRGLDGLFSLNLDDHRLAITPAGLAPLAELPRLASLAIAATDASMPYVAALPRLRHLIVQDTPAGDDGFAALARSRTLEHIWGRDCHNLRRRGLQALAAMPALRGLSVSLLNMDDEGLAALRDFPSLRELMPIGVRDQDYRHVGACVRLESLILMYCRNTTDAATEQITGLRQLTCYFNSYTTITDRTPELLSAMPSLERITFDACHGLTDTGVARLARLPRLRELSVSGRGLTPAVAAAFPASVKVQRSV
jgi:hypothetical protein